MSRGDDGVAITSVAWRRYDTGCWHAWAPGASESVCKLVGSFDGPAAREPDPSGRVCTICRARVRRGWKSTVPHLTDGPCACSACRAERARYAVDYAETIAPPKCACRCVREWPKARERVIEYETRWASLLFAWEMSGDHTTARDVEEAARALNGAWKDAAALYERLDGSHPYRRAER